VTTPRYARLASNAVADLDAAPLAPPDAGERARVIAALARQLEARARRRQRARRSLTSIAVAAGLLAVVGGWWGARHSPGLATNGPPPAAPSPQIVAHPVGTGSSLVVASGTSRAEPLDDGRTLAAGSRVVTPADGRATLSFSSGTTGLLHEGTDMTVTSDGAAQIMHLDAGAVDFHVAKLAPGERFIVDTPDAEVEVRGTRFRVSVVSPEATCGDGTSTRVMVTEGVVVVRHADREDRIGAGNPWPSGCAASTEVAAISDRRAPARVAPQAASTLAEQNDLFTSAVAAKRRGDARSALAAFDRFLANYPRSPLVESATVERMRLLHTTDPARGSAAASDYLARYPNGFAHAEAEAILAERP
jgi:ferric-dicitrate binding protein FerR (iron transport regulator)